MFLQNWQGTLSVAFARTEQANLLMERTLHPSFRSSDRKHGKTHLWVINSPNLTKRRAPWVTFDCGYTIICFFNLATFKQSTPFDEPALLEPEVNAISSDLLQSHPIF